MPKGGILLQYVSYSTSSESVCFCLNPYKYTCLLKTKSKPSYWISTTDMAQATALTPFSTKPTKQDPYSYQVGFGNSFASEALYVLIFFHRCTTCLPKERPDTLPPDQNSPQRCKYGLYAEQVCLSNSTSYAARLRIWLSWMVPLLSRPVLNVFTRMVFALNITAHHIHRENSRWMYRIRPSVAHQGLTKLPENPDVRISAIITSNASLLQI